jgi:hypothetical protein
MPRRRRDLLKRLREADRFAGSPANFADRPRDFQKCKFIGPQIRAKALEISAKLTFVGAGIEGIR